MVLSKRARQRLTARMISLVTPDRRSDAFTDLVASLLTDEWQSRAQLCPDKPKKEVNAVLYKLVSDARAERMEGSPPTWRAVPARFSPRAPQTRGTNEERLIVLVDLGNVHDSLDKLIPYAEAGQLEVVAYADLAYDGYGVRPPLQKQNVEVRRADTPDKNAADVDLIWDVAMHSQSGPLLHFIVCTKDQGFRRLERKVSEAGHRMTFVTRWEELRIFIE